jgi:hypothetical protein
MTRLLFSTAAALVVTFAGATASLADSGQLAASAGVSPTAAAGMTLDDVARAKYNTDTRRDDQIVTVTPVTRHNAAARSQLIAAAGISAEDAAGMSLSQIAAAKYNGEVSQDERYMVVSTRSFPAGFSGRSQLAAAAGLTGAEARTASLETLYVGKINREGGRDQQIGGY